MFSDNERVSLVTEPQVWILMGVFSATIFAVIGVQTTAIMRVVRVESGRMSDAVSGLRTEMVLRFQQVDRQFEQVDRRFEEVDRRFGDVDRRIDAVSMKLDGLDRDVRYLMRRELGESDS